MISLALRHILISILTVSAVLISIDVRAEQRVLFISSAFRAPYIDPPHNGSVWSLLKKVGSEVDIEFNFVDVPAARSLLLANTGQIDGDVIRRYEIGDYFPELIRVPTPVVEIAISVYSWDPGKTINSFYDFRKVDTGIVATQIGRKYIERNLSSIRNSMFVSDVEDIFSLLALKRINFVVIDRPTAIDVMGNRYGDTLFEVSSKPLSNVKYYLYLHKKHADIVDIINHELEKNSVHFPFHDPLLN